MPVSGRRSLTTLPYDGAKKLNAGSAHQLCLSSLTVLSLAPDLEPLAP